ncbi:MAG TPA: gephyrin-like molybdotransferase Glp, partial [Candidatus Binataceae bacterium]|nr:gephyrin-like molybdotransferase Glp [Candidatus Binataceae bacterium]
GAAMTSADQALQIVLQNVSRLGIERVPILLSLGRVLAEEIRSPRDIPGFDNSAMDGYAVRAADIAAASESHPVRLRVLGTVAAGMMPRAALTAGTAVRTMTGAPISDGADAIVQVERTRSEGDWVEILTSAEPGAFVRPHGEDLHAGELVMAAGKRLTPSDIGTLASLNRAMIDLYRRPRVAIVATGDELVDVDRVPLGAQVVNSSAYALASGIVEAGGEPTILKVARDTIEEVRERLSEALAFDLVLSTGGVSVGQFDHVKGVMDKLGMRQHFHGVAQKPGRPLKFGTIGGRPVFGLPGNPVSTLVCYYLYVRPALLKMAGFEDLGLPHIEVRCAAKIRLANNLTEFVRVKLERRGAALFAAPTGNQSSGVLSSLSRADGLLIGPAARSELLEGDHATVLLLNGGAGFDTEAFFEEPLRRHKY